LHRELVKHHDLTTECSHASSHRQPTHLSFQMHIFGIT